MPCRLLTTISLVALLALPIAACGEQDDPQGAATATQAPAGTATTETTETQDTGAEEVGCKEVEAPEPKDVGDLSAPKETLDPKRTWKAVVTTSCGTFTITLDVERAPETASSFAALARKDFFAGTTFHRIVPGFVIQGGDPQGTGQGGPGYSVVEAPPEDLQYTQGVVAMAKTGVEEAGTSGSQFFVVTGEDAGLPPEYALLGKVTDGLEVVERIGVVPTDPGSEMPLTPVVIEDIEIQGG